ncbi:hypothetical protein ACJX0J_039266, partial [Zea mays]
KLVLCLGTITAMREITEVLSVLIFLLIFGLVACFFSCRGLLLLDVGGGSVDHGAFQEKQKIFKMEVADDKDEPGVKELAELMELRIKNKSNKDDVRTKGMHQSVEVGRLLLLTCDMYIEVDRGVLRLAISHKFDILSVAFHSKHIKQEIGEDEMRGITPEFVDMSKEILYPNFR